MPKVGLAAMKRALEDIARKKCEVVKRRFDQANKAHLFAWNVCFRERFRGGRGLGRPAEDAVGLRRLHQGGASVHAARAPGIGIKRGLQRHQGPRNGARGSTRRGVVAEVGADFWLGSLITDQ